jgi:hypothetical protein
MTEIIKSISETTTEYFNEYAEGFINKYLDDNEDGKAIVEKLVKLWSKPNNMQCFVDHLKLWKENNAGLFKSKKHKGKKRGPKKNKSAYIIFGQHVRDQIKAENPGWNPKEISKEMGKRWNAIKEDKSLTEEYDKLAKEDKERYLTEKENYVPDDDEEEDDKKLKDKNRPKRALSAYMFFCQDKRDFVKSKMPVGTHVKDVASELGRQWNEIKNNDKKIAKYVKLALEDKERYTEEMKNYVEPSQEELQIRLDDEKAEKAARKVAKKKPSEKKKPSKSMKDKKVKEEEEEKVSTEKSLKKKTAEIKSKIVSEKKKMNTQKKRVVEEDFEDVEGKAEDEVEVEEEEDETVEEEVEEDEEEVDDE